MMKLPYLSRLGMAMLILILAACGKAADPSTEAQSAPTTQPGALPISLPAATPTGVRQLDLIKLGMDSARLLWDEQAIGSYRLTTTLSRFGADITVTVVVRDGEVISHECAPEPTDNNMGCKWARKYPENHTVAGLFAELRHLYTEAQNMDMEPNDAIDVLYDQQLGYPRRIVWNPPEYTRWTVMSFERLP
jgi:hypothetical protein